MALESQKLFPSAPGTLLLLAMVFTKLQELENIGMPWFQVDCQSSLALTSTWQQLCDQLPQIISMFIAPHPENMPTPWRYDISMFSPQRQRQGPMKFPHGTLIHIPGRLVEVPQHRHQAIAVAVGAADVGATGADVGNLTMAPWLLRIPIDAHIYGGFNAPIMYKKTWCLGEKCQDHRRI